MSHDPSRDPSRGPQEAPPSLEEPEQPGLPDDEVTLR